MTMLEVIDAARNILKDKLSSSRSFPQDDTFFTDTEMVDWYNWAQAEIQNEMIQTFENWFVTATSITTTANVEEYSMPGNCIKVVRIEDTTITSAPVEIYPISIGEKESYTSIYDANTTAIGDINYYIIKGNSFIFRPIPSRSKTIKVYYTRRYEKMSAQGTTASTCSIIPDEYHELLVWSVVENGMIKQESTAEAMATVMSRKERLIARLKDTAENRQVQRPRSVKRIKRRS